MALEQYLISEAPESVYYIPNFLTAKEADTLWQQVYSAPRPKWTQLAHRRLQNWGGIPHPKGMLAERLPTWLNQCADKIDSLGMFESQQHPNHVLINEYSAGQGIMPHEDGPLYSPVVTTISLGSHTLLDFYHPVDVSQSEDATLESRYFLSILLEPNSLLVLKNDMYKKYLHGIAERSEDVVTDKICNLKNLSSTVNIGDVLQRTTRVSLTVRNVPKTLKVKLKLGK